MLVRCLRGVSRRACAQYSTVAEPIHKLDDFRTNEATVANHGLQHIGKYYRIEPEVKKQLFTYGGLPKSFEKQTKTFGETCLMVREPAVEVMHYIKSTDLSRPTVRYVLYGVDGAGKSLTMAHLLHFGLEQGFVLVHVPWVANWFKRPKETASSGSKEGFTDLPFDAASWLVHFKNQNASILPKLDLKVSKDYVWSIRETTPAGSTLLELIEHGIARVKFASDTVEALLHELKQHSTAGRCKTMVAIDGYNALFYPQTRILAENKVVVTPDKITLTKPFLDITKYDWTNGVCVLSVDRIALNEERWESELPQYQLGKEGFEHVDPFVPIKVGNYNNKEFHSCINYYLNRRWIQNSASGFDDELKYLSASNPFKLMNICAPL